MADEKTQEPQKEKVEEKLPLLEEPITVSDYLYLSVLSLEGKAWAYMDLVVHPETQKHKKDLIEAKLAIDAMDALFRIAEAHLSSEQKKDIQYRLTNLRLNFSKG